MPAQLEVGRDSPFKGLRPRFEQCLYLRVLLYGWHVGEWSAAPQAERGSQVRRRLRPLLPARGAVAAGAPRGEDVRIELARFDQDLVAGRDGADPGAALVPQQAAQPHHVIVERGGGAGRRPVAPHGIDQAVDGNYGVRIEQQRREKRPQFARAYEYARTLMPHFQWAQQPEVHASAPVNAMRFAVR